MPFPTRYCNCKIQDGVQDGRAGRRGLSLIEMFQFTTAMHLHFCNLFVMTKGPVCHISQGSVATRLR